MNHQLRGLAKRLPLESMLGAYLSLRSLDGIAVLCYHAIRRDHVTDSQLPFAGIHVRTSTFARHCRTLSRYCHPISLNDWRAYRAGRGSLPARPVMLTFDDGYQSVLSEALPLLETYKIPAMVFVCTEPVLNGEMFWYDAMGYAGDEVGVEPLKEADHERWKAAVDAVRRTVASDDPLAPLTPDGVRTLARHGLIEIGGHTHRHPILARVPLEVQREEIETNLDTLQKWTGQRPRAFAYPNGRPDVDFTEATCDALRSASIEFAFTTEERLAKPDVSPLHVPRFMATDGLTADELLYRLARAWR
ncbi:MAG TPA: polysaccharide deacetylase family protein [Vicinamibacterales bacterium]|nr:polysaccharide deacetylase family protein [Vicinamibacterales bacterium]